MDSYVVRVYRRNQNNTEEIAGLVETVATDEKRSFRSFSGLVTAIRLAIWNERTPKLPGQNLARPGTAGNKKQAGQD